MTALCYRTILFIILLLPLPVFAQEADTTNTNEYAAERDLIESTLGTFVKVIRTATFREDDPSVSDRLQNLAIRLNAVNQSLPSAPMVDYANADDSTKVVSLAELQELETALNELYDMVRDMRMSMEADENFEIADRLATVEDGIDSAVVQTRRLIRSGSAVAVPNPAIADADEDDDEWVDDEWDEVTISYNDALSDVRDGVREARNAAHEAHSYSRKRRYYRYRQPQSPFDDLDYADAYVGEFYNKWPYRETALYRPIPALRYNRVEGLVLGVRILPLEWGDWEDAKIYGQLGYAFTLKEPRYEVGVEFRPFPYANDDFDFKIGGSYRRNTTTNDIWKVNWVENTTAALLFEYDYLDYYQVEGFNFYAIQRLSPYAQFSVGYRSEDYRSLETVAEWSLFEAGDFRINPAVDETKINSVVATLEGGQLSNMYSVPRGIAFRIDAEISDGLDNTFNFQRYLGDVRFYVPFGYSSSFGMRLRGGYATDDTPLQKLFTLGGLGSVRAYPQNIFVGSKMLLANVEYTIASIDPFDDILDDFQLFGFGDAGWVNGFGDTSFDWEDVYPAAGVGLSFADSTVRLELAWPLKDFGGERDPTLWLRLSPTF